MPQERWRSPTSLSEQELRRMQQDAQKRVERMQLQANEAMRSANSHPQIQQASPQGKQPQQTDLLSPIRALLQDEERLMLLILLYLLSREKADPMLLLALVYLMM